jgi:Ca-activated chloride channel homolog
MRKPFLFACLSVVSVAGLRILTEDPAPDLVASRPREDAGPTVSLTGGSSHARLLAGEPQEVYLHLALRAAERPDVPRLGMNLALVIDRSGSMASEDKLLFAKSAAEQLVGRLRPDDRLAIVCYDDEVQTPVPSAPAGETERFTAAIRALVPGDSTDLHGGMVRGYEEVAEHFDAERLNGVLLLSDGLANAGVSEPAAITRRAAELRERGVRVSTMGMGVAYDEDLLCGIAQQSGGRYYYVDRSESVGRYLDEEIDELARVAAREVELCVELGPGVELREAFGRPHRLEGQSVIVPMRDLSGGKTGKLVLRLGVRGAPGEQKTLASASLRYRDVATRELRREELPPMTVDFTDDVEAVRQARDLGVLAEVEIVQNGAALESAMQLQKEGELQAAQELLAARYLNSKTVNDTEYKSPEVQRTLDRILQVMKDLERTRGNARGRRELELLTELQALGYGGGN